MPVKGGAFVEMQGVLETVDGKTEGAVYVFPHVAGGIGGNNGDFVFCKGVFFYHKVVDGHGNGICKNKHRRGA